jgi:two-component system, NarL family, sensor histidine kinase DegS
MSSDTDRDPDGASDLAPRLQADLAALDGELAEIEMLAIQVKAEAARYEQKRAHAAERVAVQAQPAGKELRDVYAQLITLTRRAVLMESQADVLDAKRKSLARHRAALSSIGAAVLAGDVAPAPVPAAHEGEGSLPPSMSRLVMSAQEDLRREIARAMHDGPAQSLTNIVLQAQIVDRLLDRDPASARDEVRLLVSMVQQTLDTTKSFIFDVRPMVLDDLGLVPTLRRAARDRGRRAHVPVEFESLGTERRLTMELESTVFRLLDAALGAYLAMAPEAILIRLDWGAIEIEATVSAQRTPTYPSDAALPAVPTDDVPDAIRRMIQERHDDRDAAVAAAEAAAVITLSAATRRDLAERASAIGATLDLLAAGGEVRLVIPLPAAADVAPPP